MLKKKWEKISRNHLFIWIAATGSTSIHLFLCNPADELTNQLYIFSNKILIKNVCHALKLWLLSAVRWLQASNTCTFYSKNQQLVKHKITDHYGISYDITTLLHTQQELH